MDQATYERWWQLHLKVARGEILDEDAQADYAAGLAIFDQEEHAQWGDADLELLRKLKSEVEALQAAHERLQFKSLYDENNRCSGTVSGGSESAGQQPSPALASSPTSRLGRAVVALSRTVARRWRAPASCTQC